MATPPDFAVGQVLTAAHMDAVSMWLVKTQTVGATVASVTVSDAFSADYQNYRIIYSGGTGSATTTVINMTLGASTASYNSAAVYYGYAGGAVTTLNTNNGASWGTVGASDSTAGALVTIDVFNPFDSSRRTFFGGSLVAANVAGSTGGYHAVAASYSSFTLTPGSGTLTGGTIRVYGYRN